MRIETCTTVRVQRSHQNDLGFWIVDELKVLEVSLGCVTAHRDPPPTPGAVVHLKGMTE